MLVFFKGPFRGACFWRAYIHRGLSTEGNLCFQIDWASLIVEANLTFLFCFTLNLRALFQVQAPRRLKFRERFNGGVFGVTALRGLIFGGAYLRNFTVFRKIDKNKRKASMQTLEFEGQTHGLTAEEILPNYICQLNYPILTKCLTIISEPALTAKCSGVLWEESWILELTLADTPMRNKTVSTSTFCIARWRKFRPLESN